MSQTNFVPFVEEDFQMDANEFKVKDLLDMTGQTPDLTDREKHLIGLAVTATRGCIACTGSRIEKALESSISSSKFRVFQRFLVCHSVLAVIERYRRTTLKGRKNKENVVGVLLA